MNIHNLVPAVLFAAYVIPILALADGVMLCSPKEGAVVPLLNPVHKEFLSVKAETRIAEFTNAEWRTQWPKRGGTHPAKVTFKWETPNTISQSTVTVVRELDGKTVFSMTASTNSVRIGNFEVGCAYLWTVECGGQKATRRFTTEDAVPRWVRVDGVPNLRDLGGWRTIDGRQVRQGRIYRSAAWNGAAKPKEGKKGAIRLKPAARTVALEQLGIRTDLDLRTDDECWGMTESPLGPTVMWAHLPGKAYREFFSPEGVEAFKRAFAVFLDERNYPIVFHCSVGADRTGTLACVLNGLLGVSEADLQLDWELTAFKNPAVRLNHQARYFPLVEGFAKYPGKTFQEKTEAFVRECGFTDEHLQTFRRLMLEERDEAKLVLGIASDMHVKNAETATMLGRAFALFRDHEVDAVILAGDLCNFGLDAELKMVADQWFAVFPDWKGKEGKKTELLSVFGNRDFRVRLSKTAKVDDEKRRREAPISIYSHPNGIWKSLFGEEGGDKWFAREVKGYSFLCLHWGSEKRLSEYLEKSKIDTSRLFFCVLHPPPFKTCHDLNGGSKVAAEVLRNFPNCFAISGHSHQPITDGKALWMDGFASYGCGQVNAKGPAHGTILKVFGDRIVLERLDIRTGQKLGQDWTLSLPLRGSSNNPYVFDEKEGE